MLEAAHTVRRIVALSWRGLELADLALRSLTLQDDSWGTVGWKL
jgi:hypothetical protein